MTSILTNTSAMVALQTLKGINSNLNKTQSDISTGKNVVRLDNYPELDALLNTPHGLVGAALVGFLGILFLLHLARGIGFIHGKIAEALLVRA